MRRDSNHSEPSIWLKYNKDAHMRYLEGVVDYHDKVIERLESEGKDSGVARLRRGLASRKLEKARGL
ncbi:MAG: hypothetical protein CMA70_04365 [Euryarchaeota archaeon]|nr:hypothetical protein [Euryarchaeota archaeon]|tara:strand:+ start:926 stop:1126 length:201 start_codon:yes stop_codon:yes gene_type:complete